MSLRQIMTTDVLNTDYGKISPNYLPTSTHPPIQKAVQCVTLTGDVRKDSETDYIDQVIYTLGKNIGGTGVPLVNPQLIGLLSGTENLNLFNGGYSTNVKMNCQLLVNNLLVNWGASPNIPNTLQLQFYLNVYTGTPGDFDSNVNEIYPMVATNPNQAGSRIKNVTPIITLYRGDSLVADGGAVLGYYYSGCGTLEDFFPYNENIMKIELYGNFLTLQNTDTTYNEAISVIYKPSDPQPTLAQAGTIHYVLSLSASN